MYLVLENVGPIERADIDLPFSSLDIPKPIVLVGTNGSGKSLAVAFIANALLAMQQVIFENSEVQAGRVYKLRSPRYIRAGAKYYHLQADFGASLVFNEWQLPSTREAFEKTLDPTALAQQNAILGWNTIPMDATSTIDHSFATQKSNLTKTWSEQVMLYFPADRHDTPAWLNEADLTYQSHFPTEPHITNRTCRRVIRTAVLKDVMNWVLDVALDTRLSPLLIPTVDSPYPLFTGYAPSAETDISSLLATVLQLPIPTGGPLLTVGTRHQRIVGQIYHDLTGTQVGSNSLLAGC